MSFEDQLRAAIERGRDRGAHQKDREAQSRMSQEELRNRHTQFRLALSEHIETSLKKLCEHFPGFQYETIYGAKGWGGAVYRDDIRRDSTGKAGSFFSRLELTVRPLNEFNVVNIAGKGTIYNKEVFNWNYYKDIQDADLDDFIEKIDAWILQYAEQFAAS